MIFLGRFAYLPVELFGAKLAAKEMEKSLFLINFVLENHLNDLGTYSLHTPSSLVKQKSFKPD